MLSRSFDQRWPTVAAAQRKRVASKLPTEGTIGARRSSLTSSTEHPELPSLLSDEDRAITELRAVDIVEAIRDRRYTSVGVSLAFCKRAAIAHQLTNCLAEVLFDEALERAKELDEYLLEHGRPVGPLHGLPVSVKEHIHLKGTTATCGLIAWEDRKSDEDALIVRQFREAGAVFHVKTTNPQTLMSLETNSNLFGRTLNPYNISLTSGGSSGGEAALIAMRGSPMGIGTDIGGSIRVPSAFCGIHGFKPSTGRTPHSGLAGLHAGMQSIVGVVGPMTQNLVDADLFMSVALGNDAFLKEPAMIEKPWLGISTASPKRVGVLWDDGVVHLHPPVRRVLEQTVVALRTAGVEVVDWKPDFHGELINLAGLAYFQDGGKEYRDILEEGKEPAVPLLARSLDACPVEISVAESWKMNAEIDRLRTLYARKWNAERIDCLICPISPSVASAHDETLHWGYSCVWNVLDYPAVVIPVGKVREDDTCDRDADGGSSRFGSLDDWYTENYSPEKYANAPVAIQIVGRRLQEEKVLGMASKIESTLKRTQGQPKRSEPTMDTQLQAQKDRPHSQGRQLLSVL